MTSHQEPTIEAAIANVQRIRDRNDEANSTDKLWKFCRDALLEAPLNQDED